MHVNPIANVLISVWSMEFLINQSLTLIITLATNSIWIDFAAN